MFCSKCGYDAKDANFCPSCGSQIGADVQATPVTNQAQSNSFDEVVIWEGQPSGLVGKAKSATKINDVKYIITNQRLIVKSGLIGKKETEVDFRTVKDYKVTQSITEKVQGIGDLTIYSTDATSPAIKLDNIERPMEVKELLRKAVMDYKQRMGIRYGEVF